MNALNQSGVVLDALQMIGSTVIRAQHQVAGGKRGLRNWIFAAQEVAFMTKIHLRVNKAGLPMRTESIPAEIFDYLSFDLVMTDNLPEPRILVADRRYDTDNIR